MKRISSNMKTVLKRTVYGCIALGCVLTMVACSNTSGGSDSGSTTVASYTAEDMPTVDKDMLKLEKFQNNNHGYTGTVANLSGDKTLRLLSQKEIKNMLDATNPEKWPSNFYATTPKLTATHNTGKLTKEALQLGLNRVNVIRRLMGVHPVNLDAEYTRKAQIGAMMLAINGKGLNHGFGSNSLGIDEATYVAGNEALSHGNVASYNFPSSADNWLQDPGQTRANGAPANPMHRVWMTAPVAGKFGFGYVETATRAAAPTGYSVLRACDSSASPRASTLYPGGWDFVAWPAPGYCPIGLWPKSHVENGNGPNTIWTSPWSISVKGLTEFKLVLTKKTDSSKSWTIEYGLIAEGDGNPEEKLTVTDGIQAVIDKGPGATGVSVLSFFPTDTSHEYKDGDVYTVELSNTASYPAQVICKYEVEFFDPAQVQ